MRTITPYVFVVIAVLTSINLETTLTNVRIMIHNELDRESNIGYTGGNSTVLLFLLHGPVQSNQAIFEQSRILNETAPGEIISLIMLMWYTSPYYILRSTRTLTFILYLQI